jgi:pimeloyl-ACP methyl ester carboxylesterase
MKDRWESFTGMLKRFDPEFEVTHENCQRIAQLAFTFMSTSTGPAFPSPTFSYDLLSALPRLEPPVLLIRSATDSLSRYHERAMSLIPNVREHAFSGVNPLQNVARPERAAEYAQVLRGFLAANS